MTNLKDKPIAKLTTLLRGRGPEMKGFGRLEDGLRKMNVDQLDALIARIRIRIDKEIQFDKFRARCKCIGACKCLNEPVDLTPPPDEPRCRGCGTPVEKDTIFCALYNQNQEESE